MNNIPREDLVLISVINDLLHMREYLDLSVFSSVELNFFLENVCVCYIIYKLYDYYIFCIMIV